MATTVQKTELRWPAAKVRSTFIDFFKERQHSFVPSSPVVPLADPTLLFANAGMNQYKEIFLGTVDPASDMGKLKRAVNSQACIRAGGKHNDLEDVGRDTYHHTFFEMLGSWSFADYFKKEAIEWSWELLTVVYGLPKDRLYATYFEGNDEVPADTVARDLWLQFLPADRVLPGDSKDNFWEMGDIGPCGPCSELHFDRIGGRNAADRVNKDDPMVIEVWNLVFMQFQRKEAKGKLTPLPSPHVDTGLGLERIASILQDVQSNYDTDLWLPLFDRIQQVTGHPNSYTEETNEDAIVAYRAVADHARCLTMAIADGAVPDSVGRGFVLRRIIRRAVRYGVQFLGAKTGFFTALVPAVIESLGVHFTHLAEPNTRRRVEAILKDEEESFARTWKVGLKHFEKAKQNAVDAGRTEIAPSDVFVLHDRYGFPADLTALLAEKEKLNVSLEHFQEEMKKNQTSGGRMAANKTFFDVDQVDALKNKGVPPTVDTAKYTWEDTTANVLAIFDKSDLVFIADGEKLDDPTASVGIVVDATNFYFECGGQVYDTGVIEFPATGGKFAVERVHSFGGYIVHIGKITEGAIASGASDVQLKVDYVRRQPIAVNHTTTHQLNHALREVLQFRKPDSFTEVSQRGSFVSEESLRFDFSWNAKLTSQELKETEELLTEVVQKDLQVYSALVPLVQAGEIKSIRRNFEDKYPDPCTVISIGRPVEDLVANPSSDEWRQYSVELCGGTHIKRMGQVGSVRIVSEESLMKGIRRVVLYTGKRAEAAEQEGNRLQAELKATFASATLDFDDKQKALSLLAKAVNDKDIPLLMKLALRDEADAAIKKVLADKKVAASKAKEQAAAAGSKWTPSNGPLHVATVADFGADREPLQAAAEAFLKAQPTVGGVFLVGVDVKKDKAMAIVQLSKDAVGKGLSAVEWIKASCGKGGGKPNAAQMGFAGSEASKVAAGASTAAQAMAGKLQ